MKPMDLDSVLKTLEALADMEMVLSEFYKTCGDVWKEDEVFWSNLSQAEIHHAEYIRKIADIVKNKPEMFETARSLNITAINTVISGIKNNIQKLKNGKIEKKQAFFISRDVEQSVLESKYNEILKTTYIEYNTLLSEIMSETGTHKKLILSKIEETKGNV